MKQDMQLYVPGCRRVPKRMSLTLCYREDVDPLTPVNLTPMEQGDYKGPYNNDPGLLRRLSNAIAPAAIAV